MIDDPRRIGFLVEGNTDKEFVERFVPRILGPKVQLQVVRMGGAAALQGAFSSVAVLLQQGCERVFLLGDADTELTEEIKSYQLRLEEPLKRFGMEREAKVFLAVPMLEAWLLADSVNDPERLSDPRRELAKQLALKGGPGRVAEIAEAMNIVLARKRSKSLDRFVRELERLKSRPKRAAA